VNTSLDLLSGEFCEPSLDLIDQRVRVALIEEDMDTDIGLYLYVFPVIQEVQAAGVVSNNAIATKLNERRVPTARGGRRTHVQVGAVIASIAER
jgi:hypothetical protein